MTAVFISYSSKDRTVAERVREEIETRGIGCWIAPRDVPPGAYYADAIFTGLENSRVVVLVLSDSSVCSHHVLRELERAVHFARPILPLRITKTIPDGAVGYFLAGVQWMDALVPPIDDQIGLLANRVAAVLAADGEAPSRPDVRPRFRNVTTRAGAPPGRSTAAPQSLLGQRVGRFRLEELLGAGGAGLAFRAWDADRRTEACVKIYYARGWRPQFETTAKDVFAGLSALNDPRIVRPLDIGSFDWDGHRTHFMATDLVAGEPLDVWLAAHPSAPERMGECLRIAAGLGEALHLAHACRYLNAIGVEQVGLLHGDIKPSNVIIRANGEPVLLDFLDFREAAPDEEEVLRLSQLTIIGGTLGRMPPEQAGQGILTARSDVFGLGLLTAEVLGYKLGGPLDRLGDRPEHVPLRIDHALRQMTAPLPEQRPPDALFLCRALDGQDEAERQPAEPPQRARWFSWFRGRSPRK